MKNALKGLVAVLALVGFASGYAGVSCEDLAGDWSGAFAPYTSVTLHVTHVDADYRVELQFVKSPTLKDGVDAAGTCSVSGGVVTATFHQSIPGLGDVNLTTTMQGATQLHLNGSIPFYDFNGDLTKQ